MDRQTAQNLLDNLVGMVEDTQESDYDTAIRMGIEALKAHTQPVQRWIPCSERLPKDFQPFYATCRSNIDNRENWVIEGYYTPWRGFNPPPLVEEGKAEIIAWMPKELPEPYREEQDG